VSKPTTATPRVNQREGRKRTIRKRQHNQCGARSSKSAEQQNNQRNKNHEGRFPNSPSATARRVGACRQFFARLFHVAAYKTEQHNERQQNTEGPTTARPDQQSVGVSNRVAKRPYCSGAPGMTAVSLQNAHQQAKTQKKSAKTSSKMREHATHTRWGSASTGACDADVSFAHQGWYAKAHLS